MILKVAVMLAVFTVAAAADWSYDGSHGPAPGKWSEEFSGCGGQRQSPIDLENAIPDDTLTALTFRGFDRAPTGAQWTLQNNGHAAEMTVDSNVYNTSGGGLSGTYKVAQFHFHWGNDDTKGSEHFVEGHQYPLEMHIVHFHENYEDVTAATPHADGLAVVAVFFEIDDEDNPDLEPLIGSLANVKQDADTDTLGAFPLSDLLPEEMDVYYRYSGSLTTPGCNEVVVWTLFKDTVEISESQMEAFRGLTAKGKPLVDNFRPLQPLNDRTISVSTGSDD